jgi:hypothetical protein
MMIFASLSCSKEKIEEFAQAFTSAQNSEFSEDDYAYEESAEQIVADTQYMNSFLGFSFTVPKGWWLYSINDVNFAEDASLTEDPDLLDISYGEDAGFEYSYINLASLANLQDSSRDNHIGFDISAETLEGVDSIDEYMDYYETYILEPDNNTYELLESKQIEINGVQYEARRVKVIREEKGNYHFLSLTRALDNNYYLTILTNYWPDNRNAERMIMETLTKAIR